jgi:hypothetical protein
MAFKTEEEYKKEFLEKEGKKVLIAKLKEKLGPYIYYTLLGILTGTALFLAIRSL